MWQQGQHTLIVGSTGSGKTTIARQLLLNRDYVIAILTKAEPTHWVGWKRVATAEKIQVGGVDHARYLLSPSYEKLYDEVAGVFDRAWLDGAWTVYIDEVYYVEHELGLGHDVIKLLTQGRSKYVSVVIGVQRPAWVNRFCISEPTHILCSSLRDSRDIKTMQEINGQEYADQLSSLSRYQFLYLDRGTGQQSVVDRKSVRGVMARK